MGRTTWIDVDGIKKGEWTTEEDRKLVAYIKEHGLGDWRVLPTRAGLQRCGKSCRLRWLNYLRPGIKRGKFTPQEEDNIIKLHALLGNRWAAIAKQMPNRTDNDIKNHWNSCLKKRLSKNGIDPMTHEPYLTVDVTSSPSTSSSSSTLSPSSSSSTPSSSCSARLLNKLAAGISLNKHGLDTIKNVILSEPNSSNGQTFEEMVTINEEADDEAIGCVRMEIDEKLTTTSFDELPCNSTAITTTTTGFVAFDDFSSIDPYGLCQSDFYETELLDLFLL